MKIAITFISLFILHQSLDLNHVRDMYKNVAHDKTELTTFNSLLNEVTKTDKVELVAYKGAGVALKGRYSKKIKDKRSFFIEGVTLVEYAIQKSPNNIELRFIRLGIQDNTPKLLKYKGDMLNDKKFILTHYSAIKSSQLKHHIKNYILQSDVFTLQEKSTLD